MIHMFVLFVLSFLHIFLWYVQFHASMLTLHYIYYPPIIASSSSTDQSILFHQPKHHAPAAKFAGMRPTIFLSLCGGRWISWPNSDLVVCCWQVVQMGWYQWNFEISSLRKWMLHCMWAKVLFMQHVAQWMHYVWFDVSHQEDRGQCCDQIWIVTCPTLFRGLATIQTSFFLLESLCKCDC